MHSLRRVTANFIHGKDGAIQAQVRVTNIERPIPTASADAHSQAGQETITEFNYFCIARTHGIEPFRSQWLNAPWHI